MDPVDIDSTRGAHYLMLPEHRNLIKLWLAGRKLAISDGIAGTVSNFEHTTAHTHTRMGGNETSGTDINNLTVVAESEKRECFSFSVPRDGIPGDPGIRFHIALPLALTLL